VKTITALAPEAPLILTVPLMGYRVGSKEHPIPKTRIAATEQMEVRRIFKILGIAWINQFEEYSRFD
jgi:hypothetical protein